MDVVNLKTKIARLERELEQNRDLLRQATHDPEAFTAELIRTRAYAFDATDPVDEVVKGSIDSLSKYGFCVIDNVIPPNQVGDIREEVVAAQKIIDRNVQAIRALVAEGSTESTQIDREKADIFAVGTQIGLTICPHTVWVALLKMLVVFDILFLM